MSKINTRIAIKAAQFTRNQITIDTSGVFAAIISDNASGKSITLKEDGEKLINMAKKITSFNKISFDDALYFSFSEYSETISQI